MTIEQKLLIAYMEVIASSKPGGAAYSGTTQACMILDKVGADLADRALPAERAEIYRAMDKVRAEVLRKSEVLTD